MQRGWVSLGDVKCDGCNNIMGYLDRYLAINEGGVTLRYCTSCCLERGYAHYRDEKGEQLLTFFPEKSFDGE